MVSAMIESVFKQCSNQSNLLVFAGDIDFTINFVRVVECTLEFSSGMTCARALRTLGHLCRHDQTTHFPDMVSKLCNCGAVDVVLKALFNFSDANDVIRWGFHALGNLFCTCESDAVLSP